MTEWFFFFLLSSSPSSSALVSFEEGRREGKRKGGKGEGRGREGGGRDGNIYCVCATRRTHHRKSLRGGRAIMERPSTREREPRPHTGREGRSGGRCGGGSA